MVLFFVWAGSARCITVSIGVLPDSAFPVVISGRTQGYILADHMGNFRVLENVWCCFFVGWPCACVNVVQPDSAHPSVIEVTVDYTQW